MTALPVSRSGKEAIDVACEAARKAGEVLKTNFREERQVQYKGRANIVEEFAAQIGADGYGADATRAVEVTKKLVA